MKKVFFVLTIAISFAFISHPAPSNEIKSIESENEMLVPENETSRQCFIVDIPDENGKCYQFCPPLWEREEIPCR